MTTLKPRLNDQTFSSNIVLEKDVGPLTRHSQPFTLEWFPIFDLEQTFLSILRYEQMLDVLATPTNIAEEVKYDSPKNHCVGG